MRAFVASGVVAAMSCLAPSARADDSTTTTREIASKVLVVGGGLTFGAAYGASVVVAAKAWNDVDAFRPLVVPVVGPIVAISKLESQRGSCGAGPNMGCGMASLLVVGVIYPSLVFDTLVQAGGLTVTALGVVAHRDVHQESAWSVRPFLSGSTAGVNGTF
jgi:hypothetical protein